MPRCCRVHLTHPRDADGEFVWCDEEAVVTTINGAMMCMKHASYTEEAFATQYDTDRVESYCSQF